MTNEEFSHQYRLFQARIEEKYTEIIARSLAAGVRQFFAFAEANGMDMANLVALPLGFDQMGAAIRRLYRDAAVGWGMVTYRDLNEQKAAPKLRIEGYLAQQANNLYNQYFANTVIETVVQNTKKDIQKEIAERQAKGQSLKQIKDELSKPKAHKKRARFIARTESVKASNFGGQTAAKQAAQKNNLVLQKEWISFQDNKTRRIPRNKADHLHMLGMKVGIDDKFPAPHSILGIVYMMFPGDPTAPIECVANCRCGARFTAARDARGRLQRGR